MATPGKTPKPVEQLQVMFNDVLVQTGKALKSAHRDGKSNTGHTNLSASTRISQSIETFNFALDDLESEIIRAKSTILRDLRQAQAKRNPPVPESKPVAPPAPMVIDLEPSPQVTPVPAPVVPPQSLTGAQRQIKQEPKQSAPVAPFPNMGFDLTGSPEVPAAPTPPAKVPTPTPAKMPTPTPAKMPTPAPAKAPTPVMKNAPTPGSSAPAAARPASTPPKKETKVPVPQVPRSAAATPQASAITSINTAPTTAARAVSLPTAVASPPSQAAPESLFTSMGFTVAEDSQHQNPSQPQNNVNPQPPAQPAQAPSLPQPAAASAPEAIDLTDESEIGGLTLESFGIKSVPGAEIANMSHNPLPGAEIANMSQTPMASAEIADMGQTSVPVAEIANMSHLPSAEDSVDAKIDGLFDFGMSGTDSMDLDYDLGASLNNSNFEESMFFNSQDDSLDSGEFNDAYFNL